jgi:magnesium transporter
VTSRLAPLQELRFETAAEHYTTNVPIARPTDRAAAVRDTLTGRRFDTVDEIVVCDESGRLAGLVNIEDLLAADGGAPLNAIMDSAPPRVTPAVDQEHVAWLAIRRGETSLPVVDDEGRFQGLITPRRIFEVLLYEHDEDTARLGGFLHSTSEAYLASNEPLLRRLRHRLPWLAVGLCGAMLGAELVGLFEAKLRAQVLLMFFIPGLVYLADAVGTQTETLVIRAMSHGLSIEKMLWRESVTGFLVGCLLAAIAFPLVLLRWGHADVACAVAVALLAACSLASGVAMALPWLLRKLRQDPAYAAGPLATVMQDLLTVVVYLLVCRALV